MAVTDNPISPTEMAKIEAEYKEQAVIDRMINAVLANSQTRAKDKGMTHTITAAYLRQIWPKDNRCSALGFELKLGMSEELGVDDSPSIDRIDPTKGYVKGNVRILSWQANVIINQWPEFQPHLKVAAFLAKAAGEEALFNKIFQTS